MRPTKHLAGWSKTTFLLMSAVCLLLLLTGLVMFLLPASDLMDMSAGQAALRHGAGVVHGVCTWFFCFVWARCLATCAGDVAQTRSFIHMGAWPYQLDFFGRHRVDRFVSSLRQPRLA
jgi:hypothetical protein